MLTTPLSMEAASELRDALGRRQKELPPRWLAALDAVAIRNGAERGSEHELDTTERQLGLALLRNFLPDARPRGIVCLRPSMSSATAALVHSLCDRGSVTTIVAAELDAALATAMIDCIAPDNVRQSSAAVECDATIDLPLLERFPRPRVYLVLGNVLGSSNPVGAVRMLRVLRSTMSPGDSIMLGLDGVRAASPERLPRTDGLEAATRHFRALELLNSAAGASFDPGRFEFRRVFDAESSRHETHLVARRAFEVAVPGVCDVRFRKGESIRTAVSCAFDRTRVSAMLAGVGLALREWTTDPEARFVVALASPAT
jgi:L-histidine N-alpha-methyltransferase